VSSSSLVFYGFNSGSVRLLAIASMFIRGKSRNILIPAAFRGGKLKIAIAYVLASSSFKWIASSEIIKEYKEVLNLPNTIFHK
jgi:hypothetical protein